MAEAVWTLGEAVLYVIITAWVLGLIFRMIGGKLSPAGGGHKGMGIGGHLIVAGVVGTVRLFGQAVRALVVGFFRHVAPAAVRGLGSISSRLAARAGNDASGTPYRAPRRQRRRLPRIGVEWTAERRRSAPRSPSGTLDYPADEFSDDWRRGTDDDL